ncbi:M48 family metalloprotease [Aquabacterium sp.]|uniref:M48 family metalloprotease n=1 Tax=Aquabacterium sp. TaxID=1872578 RepID=UPI002489C130|nr:M48 family metalloprotease [Aquabacterium sp.]MDI1259858.1 M48 family metalloprotease [Aquabacterium sp.]
MLLKKTPSASCFAKRPPARPQAWHTVALAMLLAWPLGLSAASTSDLGLPPSSSSLALPSLGDAAAQTLSPMAERRLGDRIMRSILPDPDVIDDPLILEYVNQSWQALLSSARQRGDLNADIDSTHAWRPFLVRERSVNAFALPGGYIGVHLGLLAMTTTPDELASVLAHELSHVTQRHIARMISEQSRQSWISIASMILGALAVSRAPAAAQALMTGGQAIAIQGQLNFSRDMEREADRVGFGVLNDAGFAPIGMAQMFEHLQQASRLTDDNSYPYLRTHPLTSERIGEARSRMGPDGLLPPAIDRSDAREMLVAQHALMSARSRVLMDQRSISLIPLLNPTAPKGSSALEAVALHYTSAVSAQRLNDRAQVAASLKLARTAAISLPKAQHAAVERILALEEADTLVDARQAMQAAAILSNAVARGQGTVSLDARPELLLNARIALNLPDTRDSREAWQEAATRLQTHVSAQAQDATAWGLLAALWRNLGQPLRAVRAEAEATAALGDLPGAIDRIEGGAKNVRHASAADAIELSVMQSRLRVWRRQQRDDLAEDGAR